MNNEELIVWLNESVVKHTHQTGTVAARPITAVCTVWQRTLLAAFLIAFLQYTQKEKTIIKTIFKTLTTSIYHSISPTGSKYSTYFYLKMQYFFSLQWQSNDSQLLHRSHTPLPPPRSHSHTLSAQTAAQEKSYITYCNLMSQWRRNTEHSVVKICSFLHNSAFLFQSLQLLII